jgi:SSS family solute:Na+ symporter
MNSVSTLVVRDFLIKARPKSSERAQVWLGRLTILVSTPLAIASAYLIYITPDGLYRYLQAISLYMVIPIMPAIFFGILSKRVTFRGAVASVMVGGFLAILFVTDQLLGESVGLHTFPWLHMNLTQNYTYRGLFGSMLATVVLYSVSYCGRRPSSEDLAGLTVDWGAQIEKFEGVRDWRLHLALLGLITILIYAWLW